MKPSHAAGAVNWRDVAIRSANTAWQTFIAVLGVWWTASGADLAHSVTDVSTGKRFLVALGAAVLGAILTALYHAARAAVPLLLNRSTIASMAKRVEQGAGFLGDIPEPIRNDAADYITQLTPDRERQLAIELASRLGLSGTAVVKMMQDLQAAERGQIPPATVNAGTAAALATVAAEPPKNVTAANASTPAAAATQAPDEQPPSAQPGLEGRQRSEGSAVQTPTSAEGDSGGKP